MRAPANHWLAVLALMLSRAAAAETGPSVDLVTDSVGLPVRGSLGECWRLSADSGTAAPCPRVGSAPTTGVSAGGATTAGATAGTAADIAQPVTGTDFTAINAAGNPGYVVDSNGIVVRGTQGECWHTGSWSPELATIIGCDGVLAKALPVPTPAPSPRPQPPVESITPPAISAAETPTTPLPAEAAGKTAPTVPTPVPATPETPPATAAPRGARVAPEVIPPVPKAPVPSAVVPFSEPGESSKEAAKHAEPISEKVTLDTDTYFDFDKATLKPEGRHKLDSLASRLAALKLEVVVATGHTDWTGTATYNQRLSERRAQSVKNYLVQKGVPRDRIFTEGKGETQPMVSNTTRAGRAENRRVEVELVGTRKR